MNNKKLLITLAASLSSCFVALSPIQAADIEALTKSCAECHLKDGNSKDGETPIIAGISTTYFGETIAAYLSGDRPAKTVKRDGKPDTDMKKLVKDLSEADITVLGEYYTAIKPIAHDQKFDAGKAKAGKKLHKKYCEKCHENEGRSTEDDAGLLAGQWMPYLKYSLDSFVSGERTMGKKMAKKMKDMMKKDGDDSIDNLVHFYGSLK